MATWGEAERGGDSSGVELKDVVDIAATTGAFAALKKDGLIVSWGDPM